jgi:hypothetical protein
MAIDSKATKTRAAVQVVVDQVNQNPIKVMNPIKRIAITKIQIKKKIIKMIILKIKQKIINLKVYLNSLISLNFIFAILTPSIFYFYCFTRTPNYVTKAALTNKYTGAYLLPFIFAKFNPNVSAEAEPLISYSFSMFILSLLVLFCFFNIIGYIISIHLIDKYDVENKFPYFKQYIKFYSSTSKFFLVLEIIIAFVFLIFIVLLNFFLFTRVLLI